MELFFKRKYKNTSYSQCGEDRILKFLFDNILKISKPSFLDIGAHHPYYLNNTNIFYESGSSGINIDPNEISIQLFKKHRPRDISLQLGISDKATELDFYTFRYSTHNTFDPVEAEKHKDALLSITKIKVQTIEYIIQEYANGVFPDFLSLDVEGLDLRILKTIDFSTNGPKVICVESNFEKSKTIWDKNYELIHYLKKENYVVYSDTFINTIFLQRKAILNLEGTFFYDGLSINI